MNSERMGQDREMHRLPQSRQRPQIRAEMPHSYRMLKRCKQIQRVVANEEVKKCARVVRVEYNSNRKTKSSAA